MIRLLLFFFVIVNGSITERDAEIQHPYLRAPSKCPRKSRSSKMTTNHAHHVDMNGRVLDAEFMLSGCFVDIWISSTTKFAGTRAIDVLELEFSGLTMRLKVGPTTGWNKLGFYRDEPYDNENQPPLQIHITAGMFSLRFFLLDNQLIIWVWHGLHRQVTSLGTDETEFVFPKLTFLSGDYSILQVIQMGARVQVEELIKK